MYMTKLTDAFRCLREGAYKKNLPRRLNSKQLRFINGLYFNVEETDSSVDASDLHPGDAGFESWSGFDYLEVSVVFLSHSRQTPR